MKQNGYLFFFKTEEKATKAILGAFYNLTSRVLAGVIAGLIVANTVTPPQQIPATNAAGTAAIN